MPRWGQGTRDVDAGSGILARHEALDRITSRSGAAATVRRSVTALLVLIDVIAVFVKSMLGSTAYDSYVIAGRRIRRIETEAEEEAAREDTTILETERYRREAAAALTRQEIDADAAAERSAMAGSVAATARNTNGSAGPPAAGSWGARGPGRRCDCNGDTRADR